MRIPREFELEGSDAIMRQEGECLIIEPVRKGRLLDLLARLEPLPEGFPDVDDTLVPLDEVEVCLSRGPARATAAGPAGRTAPPG